MPSRLGAMGGLRHLASVDRLQAFEPTPTFIVRSGGLDGDVPKRHAWWALAEPLGRDVLEPALRRLVHHLGADPRCAGDRPRHAPAGHGASQGTASPGR